MRQLDKRQAKAINKNPESYAHLIGSPIEGAQLMAPKERIEFKLVGTRQVQAPKQDSDSDVEDGENEEEEDEDDEEDERPRRRQYQAR